MKVRAVVALKAQYRLDLLLQVAGLARSTFFYHQARLDRPAPQAELKSAIEQIFTTNHGRYGHRRIHLILCAAGWQVAKKSVLKLMRELGLVCRARRKRAYISYQGRVGRTAENVLDRDFTADRPNAKWVTDVTEFRVGTDKLYLSPVMDLFDRQIIAYTVGLSATIALTNRALQDALATLPDGQAPLVHSDQGFQYQHASWHSLLAAAGAIPSMSRKGTCLDNAVMENFFGHLKAELFHHASFADAQALMTAIDSYIAWYNRERISTTLKGLSPVQYRTQALAP